MIFKVKTDQGRSFTGYVQNPYGKQAKTIFELGAFLEQYDHIMVCKEETQRVFCKDITGCVKTETKAKNKRAG